MYFNMLLNSSFRSSNFALFCLLCQEIQINSTIGTALDFIHDTLMSLQELGGQVFVVKRERLQGYSLPEHLQYTGHTFVSQYPHVRL
jgi:hypothetical protein